MTFPETVISMSIQPKSRADRDKLGEALTRLAKEDPTFQTYTDDETGETIISGMGELHLEVLVQPSAERVPRRVRDGTPQGGLPTDAQAARSTSRAAT